MAKELKTKLVLELDDFSRKLTQAERDTKKTIAAIERESGRSITAIRGDLLGGIGAGNSMQEMRAYQREQKGIGGGPGGRFDERYNAMFSASARSANEYNAALGYTSKGFADIILKAYAMKETIVMGLGAASAATKTFQGDIAGARKELESMAGTGQLNKFGLRIGEWLADTFVEPGVYSRQREAEAGLEQSNRRAKYDQEQIRKKRDFSAETRNIMEDSSLAGADQYTKDMAAARRQREERMKALYGSGLDKSSAEYQNRKVAIDQEYASTTQRATNEDADRRFAEKQKQYDEINNLNAELAQQQLAAAGKADEAELAGIREAGRRKAEEYRRQKNEVAAVKQEELAELEVSARKKELLEADEAKRADAMAKLTEARGREAEDRGAADKSYTATGNTALVSSSLTRSPGAGFDQTLKGQVQEAKKANEYLRDIRRYIEKMSQPQIAGV